MQNSNGAYVIRKSGNHIDVLVDDATDDRYLPTQLVTIDYKDTAAYRPGTDSEINYSKQVLIGGWSEERNDLRYLCRGERLPSDHSHYYCTTYDTNYNQRPVYRLPDNLMNFSGYPSTRKNVAFPTHQPELDLTMKNFKPWETTYGAAYIHHKGFKPERCGLPLI